MRIYLSGPITGTEDYKERFEAAETKLRRLGYKVINPVRIMESLPGEMKYEELMQLDIYILANLCGAIYMMSGWEKSLGANREYGFASARDMLIFKEGDLDED